jgi:hypothetical protein
MKGKDDAVHDRSAHRREDPEGACMGAMNMVADQLTGPCALPPRSPKPPFRSDGTCDRASKPERRYALRREVARAVAAVQASGISIQTVDLRPDGTIRLSSGATPSDVLSSEFDAWEKAGKL